MNLFISSTVKLYNFLDLFKLGSHLYKFSSLRTLLLAPLRLAWRGWFHRKMLVQKQWITKEADSSLEEGATLERTQSLVNGTIGQNFTTKLKLILHVVATFIYRPRNRRVVSKMENQHSNSNVWILEPKKTCFWFGVTCQVARSCFPCLGSVCSRR